jgi:hypothetical protein
MRLSDRIGLSNNNSSWCLEMGSSSNDSLLRRRRRGMGDASPGTRARPCFLRESAPEMTDEPGRIHGAEDDARDGRWAPGTWAPGGLPRAPARGRRRTPAGELDGAPRVVLPTHTSEAAGRDLGWRPREAGPRRPRHRPALRYWRRLWVRHWRGNRAGGEAGGVWRLGSTGERQRRRQRRREIAGRCIGGRRGLWEGSGVKLGAWFSFSIFRWFLFLGLALCREAGHSWDTTLVNQGILIFPPNFGGIN